MSSAPHTNRAKDASFASSQVITESEVIRCDVAIVGGGIAGVAVAERLAREAWRQRKHLRIILLERAEQLGAETSGGLEGWYHAGGLYSRLRETRFFTHCLNSFEDLYNCYHIDPAFPYQDHCNLRTISDKQQKPAYSWDSQVPGKWFLDEISYLLPHEVLVTQSPDARWAGSEWQSACWQAKNLLAKTFFESKWWNRDFDCCQAAHVGVDFKVPPFAGRNESFEKILGERGRAELFERKAKLGSLISDVSNWYKHQLQAASRDAAVGNIDVTFDLMLSRDAVMNTHQILFDLARAAAGRGVRILTGYEIRQDSVQVPRDAYYVDAVKVVKPDGKYAHVMAQQYVFALGFGFEEQDFLRRNLGIRVRVQKNRSVMAVLSPALRPYSFAVMDPSTDFQFNHVYHPGAASGGGSYSIIADSNDLPENAEYDECARAAATLLAKAKGVFGNDYGKVRRQGWYSCLKTEFVQLEKTRRDYSFRLDPQLKNELIDPVWSDFREKNQKRTQELIKEWLVVKNDMTPLVADPRTDGWAMEKAIHFALQQRVWASRGPRRNAGHPDATFDRLRSQAIERYSEVFRVRNTRMPNFVCVVPGKFSLFPTLAHQVYMELESRGLFKDAPELTGEQRADLEERTRSLEKCRLQSDVPDSAAEMTEDQRSQWHQIRETLAKFGVAIAAPRALRIIQQLPERHWGPPKD